MYTATVVFDLKLPEVSRSLKAKRSYVRPLIAALRKLDVSVAEVGFLDRYGRTEIGVAVVSAELRHAHEVLDNCERTVFARPEYEVLSVRRRIYSEHDD